VGLVEVDVKEGPEFAHGPGIGAQHDLDPNMLVVDYLDLG
jgi:hypothetical protein